MNERLFPSHSSLVMSFTRFPPVPFPAGGGPEGVGNGEGNER